MNLPPYDPFPELTSPRVRLVEFTPAHAAALREITYYDGVQASDDAAACAIGERIASDYQAGQSVHWVILDGSSCAPIGMIGFYRGFAHNTGEVGFVLLPAYQRQGLMTAALQLVVDFGHQTMHLADIIALTAPDNVACIRLLTRHGFQPQQQRPDGYFELRRSISQAPSC